MNKNHNLFLNKFDNILPNKFSSFNIVDTKVSDFSTMIFNNDIDIIILEDPLNNILNNLINYTGKKLYVFSNDNSINIINKHILFINSIRISKIYETINEIQSNKLNSSNIQFENNYQSITTQQNDNKLQSITTQQNNNKLQSITTQQNNNLQSTNTQQNVNSYTINKDHNMLYDCVYIINLEKNKLNKHKSKFQLDNNNFLKYKFIDAINGNDYLYRNFYKKITKNLDKNFIEHNFSKGALGCYLSHLKCIADAKLNNYSKILILEDDFVIINSYNSEINTLMYNVPENWDLIYLGKKQSNIYGVKNINKFIYFPNDQTYATHALYIKNTIFDDILNLGNKINNPIDIALQELYNIKNVYSVYKDLFISDDNESDIQTLEYKKKLTWGWNIKLYKFIKDVSIKNIVIYGFKKDIIHTHNYIHKLYYKFFSYYFNSINILFYDEDEIGNNFTIDNAIIFCSPTHKLYKKYITGNNIYYIFHLDNYYDNIGYKTINSFFNDNNIKQLLKTINNYIVLVAREDMCNYFDTNINNKTICLPWFSENKYMEIKSIHNLFNAIKNNKYYAYIGTIWQDNIEIIKNLINYCVDNKLYLLLKGRVFGINTKDTTIINSFKDYNNKYVIYEPFDYNNNDNNSFEYLLKKYDIKCILTLQGKNKNTYFSNRIFENVSRGYICVTNSDVVKKYYNNVIYFSDNELEKMFNYLENCLKDNNKYNFIYYKQQQEFLDKFYGYNNINNILNFLIDIEKIDSKLITLDNKKPFKLWLSSNNSYTNKFFKKIDTNDELLTILNNPCDILITNKTYVNVDIFLVESLIKNMYCTLYLDSDFIYTNKIIELCKKYDKEYIIKNKLKINVLIGGQRAGSTLLVDYIQKLSKDVLALSGIFNCINNCETYSQHYDIANENGILYNTVLSNKFVKLSDNISVVDYFKQFEDYANYENKEILLFKYTVDFMINLTNHDYIDEIIRLMDNFKIIHVDRDDIDCYMSKKFVTNYCYADEKYKDYKNIQFDKQELAYFTENKKQFMSKYIMNFKKVKYINYDMLINNTCNFTNNLLKELNDTNKNYINSDLYNILTNNSDEYFNVKQNNLDIKSIKQTLLC